MAERTLATAEVERLALTHVHEEVKAVARELLRYRQGGIATELLAYRQAARALVEARDRSLAMVLDNRKWDESQGAEGAAIDALRALVKGE